MVRQLDGTGEPAEFSSFFAIGNHLRPVFFEIRFTMSALDDLLTDDESVREPVSNNSSFDQPKKFILSPFALIRFVWHDRNHSFPLVPLFGRIKPLRFLRKTVNQI